MKQLHFNYTLYLSFLIFYSANLCYGQVDKTSESIAKGEVGNLLDKKLTVYIQKIVDEWGLPGLSIGVINNNEIVYAKAFGYENIETKKPATIRSLYGMASVSKTLVATAIMQLVEQGRIELEAPVIKYLPYFKLDDPYYDKITIKRMLNHTSGMPDNQNFKYDTPEYDEGALERYVKSLTSEKMLSKPDRNFSYSNMAFDCLGDVIAKVSGMPFEEYMQKYILLPSGMKESTFYKPKLDTEYWASPHISFGLPKVRAVYPYNRRHSPSGTLHSNVLDMCNWALINLNYGQYKNERILDSTSYNLLWKLSKNGTNIGLCWFLDNYRSEKTVGHSGADLGYRTNFLMLPERSVAVVVLSNIFEAPVEEVTFAALNILLGFETEPIDQPIIVPFVRKMEESGIQAAVELFNSIENKYLFEYMLNNLGYELLEKDRIEEAIEVFKLNAKEFPSSWNVYDSLGEAYMKNGDTELAIKNYKKSVRLNPENQNGKKILGKLYSE
jgi:CubicO group peptidase (beta-lactamase class C family)